MENGAEERPKERSSGGREDTETSQGEEAAQGVDEAPGAAITPETKPWGTSDQETTKDEEPSVQIPQEDLPEDATTTSGPPDAPTDAVAVSICLRNCPL